MSDPGTGGARNNESFMNPKIRFLAKGERATVVGVSAIDKMEHVRGWYFYLKRQGRGSGDDTTNYIDKGSHCGYFPYSFSYFKKRLRRKKRMGKSIPIGFCVSHTMKCNDIHVVQCLLFSKLSTNLDKVSDTI